MLAPDQLRTGLIVRHAKRAEWGLGKVIHVDESHANVYFKDIVGMPKDAIKALSKDFALQLLVAEPVQTDPVLDNLPPMVRGGRVLPPRHVRLTEQQSIDMFIARFRSFEDSKYLDRERDYKWEAHRQLKAELFSRRGRALVDRGPSEKLSQLLGALLHTTNLLATQELIAIGDGLSDARASWVLAEAILAYVDDPDGATFQRLVDATEALPRLGNARVFCWPTVTLLPFLADPKRQMYLKPKMTQRIADIFCFDLLYDPRPDWAIYQRLLVLSEHLLNRLRPLGARDLIDVQSFMWIVAGDHGR